MFVSLALALASYSLSFLHRKLAIQICFGKVAGENGKKLLPETSLSYQKRITPMGVFNFSTLYASTANDSWVRIKVGKQHYYKKGKQIGYLTIFNIINILTFLSTDGQSALLLRVPSLLKLKYAIFRCYISPDGSVWFMDNLLCLRDVWKSRSYVNSNVSISLIFNNGQFYLNYYFLHHRNPPVLKRFS